MIAGRASLERATPWALAAWAAWDLRAFLQPGLPLFFDAHSHLARTSFVATSLRALEFPGWTQAWYAGYPLLEFYSPLYYWVAAAWSLILGDVVLATKLLLVAGLIAMALGAFAFQRALGQPLWSAALGAMLLLRIAPREWVIGTVGALPSLLVLVALPWLLAHFVRETGRAGSARRLVPGAALLFTVAASGHLTNALAQVPALAAFGFAWLRVRGRQGLSFGRTLVALVQAAGLAAVVLVGVWVPALLERGLVSLDRVDLGWQLAPVRSALGLDPWSRGHALAGGHSVGLVSVAAVACLLSLASPFRAWRPLAAGFGAALLSTALLGDRAVLLLPFFLVALASAVAAGLASWLGDRRRVAGAVFAVGTLVGAGVWDGPVDPRSPRYLAAEGMAAYARLPETPTRSRTFDITPTALSLDGFYGVSSWSPTLSGRAVPFGGFPQGALRDTSLQRALMSVWVSERERVGGFSALALDAAYLAHVQFLIDRGELPLFGRRPGLSVDGERIGDEVFQLRHASPAIYAERAQTLPQRFGAALGPAHATDPLHEGSVRDRLARTREREDWRLLAPSVEAMGLDRERATAAVLFTVGPVPREASDPASGAEAGPAGATEPPQPFEVLAHDERPQRISIVARAPRRGYLRIAYAYHPGLRVRIDGRPAQAVPAALGGASVIGFPAGTHTLEVRAPAWHGRAMLAAVSWAAGLLTALAWWRAARAGRSPAPQTRAQAGTSPRA